MVAGSKQKGKFASVNVVDSIMFPDIGKFPLSQISPEELRVEQKKDATIGKILTLIETGSYPTREYKMKLDKNTKTLANQ